MNRNVFLLAAILFGIVLCGIVALIRPLHASESFQLQDQPSLTQSVSPGK